MKDERLKQLMVQVGLPNSRSLHSALLQVENETEQRVRAEYQAALKARDEALAEFCGRVESGEVRSSYTYAKFKLLLEDKSSAEALNAACREYAAKVLESIMDDDYISVSARSWLAETARCLLSGAWSPLKNTEEQYQESPEPEKPASQLRKEGRLYCPECYTFGHSHRRNCSHRNDGMSNHVSNEEMK